MRTYVVVVGGSIIIAACITAIIYAVYNYQKLSEMYVAYLTSWMEYCGDFIRTFESLRMKNTGDDPNQSMDDILYIDYIENADLFY